MNIKRRTFAAALTSSWLPLPLLATAADKFPSKPLKIICPFAPGGGSDFIARVAATILTEQTGQPCVVDNRPGAGGTLGTEAALRSQADGYSLLLVAGSYTVNPSLYKLRFDPINDMTPVIQLSKGAYVLCVNTQKLGVKTLQELIEYGKKNPNKLTYASAGNGSHLHIATAYLFGMAGVQALHVPYKGTGPAVTDLLSGSVDMLVAGTEALMQHVKSGKLRALAVTTNKRLAAYPDIPTVAEAGVPGYDVVAWHGLIAPKGVAPDHIQALNDALNKGLASKSIMEKLEPTGVSPAGGTPQLFGDLIRTEVPRYAKVVKDNHVHTE